MEIRHGYFGEGTLKSINNNQLSNASIIFFYCYLLLLTKSTYTHFRKMYDLWFLINQLNINNKEMYAGRRYIAIDIEPYLKYTQYNTSIIVIVKRVCSIVCYVCLSTITQITNG